MAKQKGVVGMTGSDDTIHVMLLFLSDTKYNASKNMVQSFDYDEIDGKVQLTNEAAVRYLMQNGYQGKPISLSKIYLFASKKVQKAITGPITRTDEATGKTIREDKTYCRDDGTPWTHLAYFGHRISDMFPQLQKENSTFITKINYDEDLPAKKSMQSVVDMAGQIQQDMKSLWKGKKIVLHADCTGGLRHANMMMLSVLRLMQYSGIEIGKILYANFNSKPKRVEEANLIYDTFGLVAGAEEFSNYGSVQAIKKFYNNEALESPELKTLIQAMEQFDDAIKLCHYGYFKKAIQRLQTAIRNYPALQVMGKELPDETTQSIYYNTSLAATLLPRIKKDYSDLLNSEELDDLTLIDWCLNHGYLQQALTLYTERIPEVLLDPERHLLRFNPAFRKDLDALNDSMGRSENFLILNEFGRTETEHSIKMITPNYDATIREFKRQLKKDITRFINKDIDVQDVIDNVNGFVETHPFLRIEDEYFLKQLLLRIKEWRLHPALLKGSVTDEVFLELVRRFLQSVTISEKSNDSWKANVEKLCDKLQNFPHGKGKIISLLNFLKSQLDLEHIGDLICNLEKKYTTEALILVQNHCLESDFDDDVVLEILTDYYEVKDERNHTNHARLETDNIKSSEELKQFMKTRLNKIRELSR
ncbi:hypothetical protein ACQRAB_00925 [Megasphaera elsdenii]|uniref:hypothetical protein n=1 Tax=Megasphaera elsdenii TaxID=907 RepID=UPI003D04906E